MKIEIKCRFSGSVLFSHECERNTIKLTVEKAVSVNARLVNANLVNANLDGANLGGARLDGANLGGANLDGANLDGANLVNANLDGANLGGANLDGANLGGANLDGANLDGANLDGANLDGANLVNANLDGIKADFFDVLSQAKNEVGFLRAALVEGRVDGSTYTGECACLVGTIANARHENYQQIGIAPDSSRPAERWFMGISKGDTPENNQVSAITLGWVDEFLKEKA